MNASADDLLPTAKDLMTTIALAESEKATQYMRERAAAEAEKQKLIEQMQKPSGVSDEEGIRRGAARAINQQEPGWESTLTGVPKEIYQLWYKYFRPRGYKLRVQIVDWPGGIPGDVGMTLSWR